MLAPELGRRWIAPGMTSVDATIGKPRKECSTPAGERVRWSIRFNFTRVAARAGRGGIFETYDEIEGIGQTAIEAYNDARLHLSEGIEEEKAKGVVFESVPVLPSFSECTCVRVEQ